MKYLVSFILFLVIPMGLHSQSDRIVERLSSFVKNAHTFNHLYPQEKVYLHFDNTGYFLGETIWFKAYVTLASTHSSSPLSHVLYVELLNEEGYIMESGKYRIENGQAHGQIPLTRIGMRSGFYEVRAYTRLMLNWDESSLFSRVFPVFEPPAEEGLYSKKRIRRRSTDQRIYVKRDPHPEQGSKKLNFICYPEGGSFVEGITSLVAFKATDKQGRSLNVTGEVRDPAGHVVSSFSTHHQGMGSFTYTPHRETISSDKVYVNHEGKEYVFPLPQVAPSGVVLSVNTLSPEDITINVSTRRGETKAAPLGLIISCRGQVNSFYVLNFDEKDECTLQIPREQFQAGVSQIALFDAEGTIYAQRLLFANKGSQVDIKASWNQSVSDSSNPVQLDFKFAVDSTIPLPATFSLSVRDALSDIPSNYSGTIQSNLLLSSDLKGFIEDVDYYFASEDRTHLLSLDLLMLTQGWYRYSTDQLLETQPFTPEHPIEKGILVNGSVKTVLGKKGVRDIDVNMWLYSLENGDFQKGTCPTDASGNFNFLAEDIYGKHELQLESLKKGKRKEYWISLDRLFSPPPRSYSYWDTSIPNSREEFKTNSLWVEDTSEESDSLDLANLSRNTRLLKNVTVTEKNRLNRLVAEKSSIIFDVAEEEERMGDEMSGYNETLLDFLIRTVPYFNFHEYDPLNVNKQFQYRKLPSYKAPEFINPVYCTYKNKAALFVIDGIRLDATGYYGRTIYAADIEKIYILENKEDLLRYYYAPVGPANDLPEVARDLARLRIEDQERENDRQAEAEARANRKFRQNVPAKRMDHTSTYPIVFDTYSRPVMVIYLQTYKNGIRSREPIGVRKTHVLGYTAPREFYSPDYKEYTLPDEADYRRTLYWNPNVQIDTQGNASVTFYNKSAPKAMKISAETITSDGTPGSYYSD